MNAYINEIQLFYVYLGLGLTDNAKKAMDKITFKTNKPGSKNSRYEFESFKLLLNNTTIN